MKKSLLALLLLLSLAPAALAQSPMDTLRAERAKVGTPMSKTEIVQILNATALKHGMFLLAKPSGNNCPLSNGNLVSCDYLVRADGGGYDVLSDQEGAGKVVGPNGDPSEFFPSERLIAPVGSVPTPSPTPTPAPAPAPDLSKFVTRSDFDGQVARIDALSQMVDTASHQIQLLRDTIVALTNNLDSRIQVLESRPVPTKCTAKANLGGFGIPLSCSIQ